jgi:hypothetical protein
MTGARITLDRVDSDAEIVEQKKGIPRGISKVVLETVIEERQNHRRQPKPEPPEGGITLRAAERKYGISCATLSRWTTKGYIPVLLRTNKELYLHEEIVAKLATAYNQGRGQGKWTIKQILKGK